MSVDDRVRAGSVRTDGLKLSGKRALITGSSEGFGLAVARAFVGEGSDIVLCGRRPETLFVAQRELSETAGRTPRVLAIPADVSRPDHVERLVEGALSGLGGLDVLVCNAGVYGPKGRLHEVDWAEWSSAIGINLMGVALTCRGVLRHFLRQRHGKILILSGGGATRPLPYLSAYAASKAAVVRLAETLAEEVGADGIDVNAIAPGAMNTRLLDEILAAGPEHVGTAYYAQAVKQKADGGVAMELGASLCVFLASSASDGITGKLISAVWDPWRTLPGHLQELKDSDIYTLRRIVPDDRGKIWR